MVTVAGSLIVLVVGLLVGGLAIHVASTFVLAGGNYRHAVVTAAVGAVAWWLVDLLLGSVGLGALASLVGLVAWVAVVRSRYRTGWIRAGILGVLAWVAAVVVLGLLAAAGVGGLEAYGVPGA